MSDALEKDNNANIIRTFSVSNLSDRKSFPENSRRKSETFPTP